MADMSMSELCKQIIESGASRSQELNAKCAYVGFKPVKYQKNIKKIMEKSEKVAGNSMLDLFTKYDIVATGKETGQSKLTLSRISAGFPEATAGMLNSGTFKFDLLEGKPSSAIPDAMKSSSFASLIPLGSSKLSQISRSLHLQFLYDVDQTINSGGKTSTIAELKKYRDIVHKSNLIPDKRRGPILKDLGLAEEGEEDFIPSRLLIQAATSLGYTATVKESTFEIVTAGAKKGQNRPAEAPGTSGKKRERQPTPPAASADTSLTDSESTGSETSLATKVPKTE